MFNFLRKATCPQADISAVKNPTLTVEYDQISAEDEIKGSPADVKVTDDEKSPDDVKVTDDEKSPDDVKVTDDEKSPTDVKVTGDEKSPADVKVTDDEKSPDDVKVTNGEKSSTDVEENKTESDTPDSKDTVVGKEKEAPSGEDVADGETVAEKESENSSKEKPKASLTVEEYLNEHGFSVDFSKSKEYDRVVEPLKVISTYIAKHYDLLHKFLAFIRVRLAKNLFISFSVDKLSEAEKDEIIRFAKEKLSPYGMLSNTYYNFATNVITAQIPASPRVHSFLAGGWLEIFSRQIVEKILSERAKELGVGYSIYSNLLVSKDDLKHELDVVFKLENGKMCWVECKSGNFCDFAALYNVGVDMATIPSHTLLLVSNSSKDSTDAISYLYEIFCANLDTFTAELSKMINESINNN